MIPAFFGVVANQGVGSFFEIEIVNNDPAANSGIWERGFFDINNDFISTSWVSIRRNRMRVGAVSRF